MTPEQVAELRAALAKATPGPWRTFAGVNDDGVWAACGPEHAADYDADETNEPGDVAEQAAQRDAELIALMRNALPSLLDAAERCGSLAIELQEVKRVDLEQMEWMSERINELDRRNDEQDRHRRKALADLAAVRGACALALRWLGDPDDPNGTFEDIGAWYQRETGRLRPGKSLPMAMAGDSQEEREKHFRAWADAKDREVRAALKSAGGASRTERGAHAKGFA